VAHSKVTGNLKTFRVCPKQYIMTRKNKFPKEPPAILQDWCGTPFAGSKFTTTYSGQSKVTQWNKSHRYLWHKRAQVSRIYLVYQFLERNVTKFNFLLQMNITLTWNLTMHGLLMTLKLCFFIHQKKLKWTSAKTKGSTNLRTGSLYWTGLKQKVAKACRWTE